jgi:SMODS and SLOG-associating 2TM effector domain 3/SMODS and SLOG-associating 2TM effector domain 1
VNEQDLAGGPPAAREPSLRLTDEDLPGFFTAADNASLLGQRQRIRTLAVMLILTVIAAIAGAITIKVTAKNVDVGGIVSGAAFSLALCCSIYLLQMRPERNWYVGRAAAESARTLAWLYAVGGNPFSIESGENPDDYLITRLREIADQLDQLNMLAFSPRGSGPWITPKMRAIRASTLAVRKEVYSSGRINAQLDWYNQRAQWNGKRGYVWLRITIGLQGIGLIVAVARSFGVINFDLLGLIAAAAAATAAWLEAKDHGTLAEAYTITAFDLTMARERVRNMGDNTSEADWSRFVEGAELAISREHTLWLARGGVRWINRLGTNYDHRSVG